MPVVRPPRRVRCLSLTLSRRAHNTPRRVRATTFALIAFAGALAGSGALLAQTTPVAAPFMSVSEVRPGMRGYGLSVFRGTRPERFDVEVIDVVHNFRPHMDAILIRPSHPITDHAGTVAGMSGSPIYLENRLVGAYAYGWEFGRDPVAGVTPIEAMMADARRPRRTPPGLLPGSQVPFEILAGGRPLAAAARDPWGSFAERAMATRAPLQTAFGALTPVATPLTVGGMGDRAFRNLRDALEPLGMIPVQAGGGGTATPGADVPTRYENGGAVAVRLMSGDISANGTGTVTRAEGNEVVAFGHPMMGMGETLLPAAIARITWVLASERRSMKISEAVRDLGALTQDRPTTIVVDAAARAPVMPVRVTVRGVDGAPHTTWNVNVAGHRNFAPRLAASVLETALEETAGDHGDVAWTVRARVALRGRNPVEFVDHGSSGESVHAASAANDFMARVMDNAFGVIPVDGVSYEVDLHWARDFSYIRNVSLSQAEVDPGGAVDLRVNLARYGEQPDLRTVRVEIPRELAGRDVELEVSGGGETTPDLAEPESLDDLVRNLQVRFPDDALVVSVKMPGAGVTLRGRVVQNLPSSALDALRPGASTDGGDPVWNVRRTVVPVGRIVIGRDRVRLRVREVRL